MFDLHARVLPKPMADGDVHAITTQVHHLRGGVQLHVDLWMLCTETRQPRRQPRSGERGGSADPQRLPPLQALQRAQAALYLIESLFQLRVNPCAGRTEHHALARALEQHYAGAFLQQFQLLADRAGRHPHRIGGCLERAVACGLHECA
ncbi:hypothetical protein D3C81_1395170 [compost metagenome]